ncbi:unnamed protein product [Boreogadus saida]
MADKGFTIEKPLADRGATLIIPSFKMTVHRRGCSENTSNRPTLNPRRKSNRQSQGMPHLGTHCPFTLSATVNQLWTVCCVMTKFQGPLDLKGYIPVE